MSCMVRSCEWYKKAYALLVVVVNIIQIQYNIGIVFVCIHMMSCNECHRLRCVGRWGDDVHDVASIQFSMSQFVYAVETHFKCYGTIVAPVQRCPDTSTH